MARHGVSIINRQLLMNPAYMDELDIQREGFHRAQELQRSTGVSGSEVSKDAALSQFDIWWRYEGSDASTLSKAKAQSEWIRGFRGRGWGRGSNPRRHKSSIPEFVEPGTHMFLNDEWSVNVEVEVLQWNYGHSEKIGYGDTYDKALVRKIYFNKERVVHHYQLSFEPR